MLVELVRIHGPVIDPSLPTTTLTENLVRIVVVILGLLVILTGLGLQITPMLTALGVGGLAIALALQDTLANLFAGFYLTVAKQIRIGNYIRLSSGEEGYLVDIDWRASRLRQLTNNTVLDPEREVVAVDRHQLPLTRAGAGVAIEASVDYGERSRQGRAHHDRGGTRGDANRAGRRASASNRSCGSTRLAIPGIGFSVMLRAQEFVDQYLVKHEFVKRLHSDILQRGDHDSHQAHSRNRDDDSATAVFTPAR